MNIEPQDRAKVKAECLRLLVTLKLDPARMQLISGFVDTYLKLNSSEKIIFEQEISKFNQPIQENVMEITTSWKQEGIEQGIAEGIEREKALILRQLKRKLGNISSSLENQIMSLNIDVIEELGEAFLDFSTVDDLVNWLNANQS